MKVSLLARLVLCQSTQKSDETSERFVPGTAAGAAKGSGAAAPPMSVAGPAHAQSSKSPLVAPGMLASKGGVAFAGTHTPAGTLPTVPPGPTTNSSASSPKQLLSPVCGAGAGVEGPRWPPSKSPSGTPPAPAAPAGKAAAAAVAPA